MGELRYHTANVFTGGRLLGGNQLAVFTDAEVSVGSDEKLMQLLARQLNLSETAFVFPPREGGDAWVRLFSTVTEVPFAGHPLLGTAAVLASQRSGGLRGVRLETGRGIVTVSLDLPLGGNCYTTWMSQPLPTITPFPRGDELLQVLGIERSVLPIECYDAGIPHVYVVAETVEEVERVIPDFPRLGAVAGTCRINVLAGSGLSYTSRMLSPFDYVPEDPACGSAAGPLALHLLRYGLIEAKQEIIISQGAQVGRPSTLHASIRGTRDAVLSIMVGGEVHLIGDGAFRLA